MTALTIAAIILQRHEGKPQRRRHRFSLASA
jgi:hypothetical protein